MRTLSSICLSIFIAAAGNAFAAEGTGDLDVTIRMMDARQTADEFINRIELPKDLGGAVPAAADVSNQKTPARAGASDARKRRDGGNSDDGRRGGDERSDRQAEPPDADRPRVDANRGFRDRAAEQRENFQETSREQREQQESSRQNSRDNWDRFRDSYPPSAWPDRQK